MEQLEEDLAQRGGKKGKANSENLPKGPARHELSGFRGVVTSVKFHPSISVIVASSPDGVSGRSSNVDTSCISARLSTPSPFWSSWLKTDWMRSSSVGSVELQSQHSWSRAAMRRSSRMTAKLTPIRTIRSPRHCSIR